MESRSRWVTGQMEAMACKGDPGDKKPGAPIKYPPVGTELENIRVCFTWDGVEFESIVFDEFVDNTEPVPAEQ